MKYISKREGILDNHEFIKDNQTEHKKLMNENLKKTYLIMLKIKEKFKNVLKMGIVRILK